MTAHKILKSPCDILSEKFGLEVGEVARAEDANFRQLLEQVSAYRQGRPLPKQRFSQRVRRVWYRWKYKFNNRLDHIKLGLKIMFTKYWPDDGWD